MFFATVLVFYLLGRSTSSDNYVRRHQKKKNKLRQPAQLCTCNQNQMWRSENIETASLEVWCSNFTPCNLSQISRPPSDQFFQSEFFRISNFPPTTHSQFQFREYPQQDTSLEHTRKNFLRHSPRHPSEKHI